jgi:hypothetical protein
MSNPDLDRNALLKSALVPSAVSRRQRRAADAKALQEAYDDVDARDGGICWATGRFTVSAAVDPRVRREHHHLKGRRVKPEWVCRSERIITLCAEAHALVTAGWIEIEGTDARRPLFFHWSAIATSKPFELRPRHRREHE